MDHVDVDCLFWRSESVVRFEGGAEPGHRSRRTLGLERDGWRRGSVVDAKREDDVPARLQSPVCWVDNSLKRGRKKISHGKVFIRSPPLSLWWRSQTDDTRPPLVEACS